MNISTTLGLTFNVQETLAYGFASATVSDQIQPGYQFTAGTASNQADLHFEKKGVTLAAGATVTYTLSALADDLGRTVALAHLKALVIQTTTRTAGDYLSVGNAALHPLALPWGTTAVARCYAALAFVEDLTDGAAVAPGSADQLLITNSGANSVTFNIGLVGTST